MKVSLIRHGSIPRALALMAAFFLPVMAFAGWSLPSSPVSGTPQTIGWSGSSSGPVVIVWAQAPGSTIWMGFGSAGVGTYGQASLTTSYNFSTSGVWALRITNSSSVTIDSASLYVGPNIPDTTPPTVPGELSATGRTSSSISLTWTASTDNVGVTGYEVSTNGSVVANVTTNSATVANLASNTSYTFSVRARDAAGNWSGSVVSSAISTLQAPPTPIYGNINGWTLPINGVVGQSYSITWQGSANGSGFVVLFLKAPGSSTWAGCGSGGSSSPYGPVTASGGFSANAAGTWQFGVGYGGAQPSYTSATITVN